MSGVIPPPVCLPDTDRDNFTLLPFAFLVKDKAIPLQAWTGHEGSRGLRLPDSKTVTALEGGKVVSPKHWPYLPPRKYSWYSFLLESESTPGP